MQYRLGILLAVFWITPAWAMKECHHKNGQVICHSVSLSHNCSLLTVTHSGTVSVVNGLTYEQATNLEQKLLAPETVFVVDRTIERTEVFCD